jgi:hypothetical protein
MEEVIHALGQPTPVDDIHGEKATTADAETKDYGDDSKDVMENTKSSGARVETLDHSNRRIVVQNVFKYTDNKAMEKDVKKWVEQMKEKAGNAKTIAVVEIEKVRKPPKSTWAVVTVKEEAMCQLLIDFVNTNDILNKKGGKLFAKLALQDSQVVAVDDRKRPGDSSKNDRNGFVPSKRQRMQEEERPARRPVTADEIKDKITPLWRLSAEEQRDQKTKEMIKKCAMKIIQDVKERFRYVCASLLLLVSGYVHCGLFGLITADYRKLGRDKNRKQDNGLYPWLEGIRPITMEEVVSAPTPLRNKCEFNFGYRYLLDQETGTTEGVTDVEPGKVPALGSWR